MLSAMSFIEGVVLTFALAGFATIGYFSLMASTTDFRFPWEDSDEEGEE